MRGLPVLLVVPFLLSLGVPPADADSWERLILAFDSPTLLAVGDPFHGGTVVEAPSHGLWVVVEIPARLVASARAGDSVLYGEVDTRISYVDGFVPSDPYYPLQFGPATVGAPAAWAVTRGSTGVSICVVDTGVRYDHTDLSGNWAGGYNAITPAATAWDDNGHGTHVAGIAAARLDNDAGIAGLANVRLFGVKVLAADGAGFSSDVAEGITWCADNGGSRTIINLSLGAPSMSLVIAQAVEYAVAKGALVVAAAGNGGCSDCVDYPAALPGAIAVGCVDAVGSLCSFSSRGPEVELAAPGYSVLSTDFATANTYSWKSGTSMSTPHVSGVAALVWSARPTLDAAALRLLLGSSSLDLGSAGRDASFGLGLVDAACALELGRCVPVDPEDPGDHDPPTDPPADPPAEPPAAPAQCVTPLAFGYSCTVTSGAFEDIRYTGRPLSLRDEQVASARIGFSFNLLGKAGSTAYISSNGWLSLSRMRDAACCSPTFATTAPNHIVAGYWADLDPSTTGSVQTATLGTAPHRRFIVQWTDVTHDSLDEATFQIVLHEGSNDVEVRFLAARSDGSPHLTGIEDASGTKSLTYQAGDYSHGVGSVLFHPLSADVELAVLAPSSVAASLPSDVVLRIRNNGPDNATAVRASLVLPRNVLLGEIPGDCSVAGSTITCLAGDLEDGEEAAFPIGISSLRTARYRFTASAVSDSADPVKANNVGRIDVTVRKPLADVGVVAEAGAGPVPADETISASNLLVSLNVTNHGPEPALGVVVTHRLPRIATVADLSPGCTVSRSTLTCRLGDLPAESSWEGEYQLVRLRPGSAVDVVKVTSGSTDTVAANNAASVAYSFV